MLKLQTSPNRIWAEDGDHQTIAEVTFSSLDANTVNIDHTFVDDSLRGQGVAGKLMVAVGDYLRAHGKKARLTCSYAVKWFPEHQEYEDILKK